MILISRDPLLQADQQWSPGHRGLLLWPLAARHLPLQELWDRWQLAPHVRTVPQMRRWLAVSDPLHVPGTSPPTPIGAGQRPERALLPLFAHIRQFQPA